jgi:hypothetical protein
MGVVNGAFATNTQAGAAQSEDSRDNSSWFRTTKPNVATPAAWDEKR